MLLRDDDYDDDDHRPARDLILEQYLPYRLAVLSERMSEAFKQRSAKDHDLLIGEWRVMATLYREEPQSAYELCAQSNMDKVQMSRTVARLEKKQWLQKENDRIDRRRQFLKLTEQGRAVFADIVENALDYEVNLYAALTLQEQADLNRLLQKLSTHVEKLRK